MRINLEIELDDEIWGEYGKSISTDFLLDNLFSNWNRKNEVLSIKLLKPNNLQEIFNVNRWAKVTLTKEGAEQINEYNRQYHGYSQSKEENEKYFPTSYKEGDIFEGELHQLFHIFGSKLAPGFNTPFLKNEITIFKNK